MHTIDWQTMLAFQQHLYQFSRALLVHPQKEFLTASELELLGWLYLSDAACTPLRLSQVSGMKKEAVSRCLKGLLTKGCIEKTRQLSDERSYLITLSAKGEQALQHDYQIRLQPFYDLSRKMGDRFESLFKLIAQANELMDSMQHKE